MRPYPWDSLPRWSRSEAALSGRMAELARGAELAGVARTLSELLEVDVRVAPGRVGATSAERLPEVLAPGVVGVALEHRAGRLAVELEPAMALAIVDRVLGGEGASPAAAAPLSAVEEGVLAFLAARACAADTSPATACVVVDVFETREGLRGWLGEGTIACWGLTLVLGARQAPARLWVPERTLSRASVAIAGELPRALGEVPVRLAARLGRASLPAREVASLAAGDVLLPDELGCGRDAHGAPEPSELSLTSGSGAAVVRLRRDGGDWIVRGLERGAPPRSATLVEAAMTESKEEIVRTGELAVVAEVPVEVSIELGRIELRVSELAALVPGRVISARIPVGGPVELRAAGRTLAVGELVDVEGELGVRILERT